MSPVLSVGVVPSILNTIDPPIPFIGALLDNLISWMTSPTLVNDLRLSVPKGAAPVGLIANLPAKE